MRFSVIAIVCFITLAAALPAQENEARAVTPALHKLVGSPVSAQIGSNHTAPTTKNSATTKKREAVSSHSHSTVPNSVPS